MVIALVAAAIAGGVSGGHAAISALLGGLIGVLSGYAYAWRAWRKPSGVVESAEANAKSVFRAQAAGESLKFALTLLGFALVFRGYREVAALPLFLAYAATIVVYWMALLKQR